MPVDLIFVLIIILVIVLIWRGPKTLPKIGEALGRGVREAKSEATNVQKEIQARTDGSPTDGSPTDGSRTDGSPTDGSRTDGSRTDDAGRGS